MEKDMLGLYISAHPLHNLREVLEFQVKTRITDLAEFKEGDLVSVGGMLTALRRVTTRKNDLMLVAQLEDLTGTIPVVVFPKAFAKFSGLLVDDAVLLMKGKLNRDTRTDDLNILIEEIEPIGEIEEERVLHLELENVTDQNLLAQVKEQLLFFPGDEMVYLHLKGRKVLPAANIKVKISPELVTALQALLGTSRDLK
jgi:DNA polymerase-3 subunit alpha